MSPRDAPLWARGAAAALFLVASWWLAHAAAVRTLVGTSAALLGIGVLAAFVIRGLGLPLGLWPAAPPRPAFQPLVVVGVAGAFAALVLLARPTGADALRARLDPGLIVAVTGGVVAWGYGLALVRQRAFARWYAAAVAAALGPYVVALTILWLTGPEGVAPLCLWSAPASGPCEIAALRAFALLVALGAAAALVTVEPAFRRVLVGEAGGAGVAVVAAAAVVTGGWVAALGTAVPALGHLWWLGGLAGAAAGSLYVLAGSLPVAALYTGLVAAAHVAPRYAAPALDGSAAAVFEAGGAVTWLHELVVLLLLAAVYRRNGMFGGLR